MRIFAFVAAQKADVIARGQSTAQGVVGENIVNYGNVPGIKVADEGSGARHVEED